MHAAEGRRERARQMRKKYDQSTRVCKELVKLLAEALNAQLEFVPARAQGR